MNAVDEQPILERLRKVRLPAIPQVLAQLLELSRQDNAGMPEVAAVIRRDPAMTVRILDVASGPMYRRGRTVLSLEQSLLTIGMNMVRTIVISESVLNAFDDVPGLSVYDLRPFWAHSLTAAVAAREIAVRLGYARTEEAYLAGLLHDVGRLVLLGAAPSDRANHILGNEDEALADSETRFMGMTHGQAGAWVAEQWKFDSFIADSIRYHHESDAKLHATHPLLRIVALADQIAARPRNDARITTVAALCGLRPEHLDSIERTTRTESGKLSEHVGFDIAAVESSPLRLIAPEGQAQPARAAIAAHMQDMVLASALSQTFGTIDDKTSVYDALTRSACVLFGFGQAVCFTVDKAERLLRSAGGDAAALMLSEFSMPLSPQGRITDALLRKQVLFLSAASAGASIFEEQLCRLLDTRTIVVVPLAEGHTYSGVMIAAVNEAGIPALKNRTQLLRIFGEHANKALARVKQSVVRKSPEAEAAVEEYRTAARAIVHEVNNPLSIIRNYLTVLDRKISRKESVESEIGMLQEEIDRVTQLVESFAELEPAPQAKSADLAETVTDVVNLLCDSEFAPASVSIALHRMAPTVQVACDPGALKQIFLNLLKNAIEALDGKGRIDISYLGVTSQDGRQYASLSVKDNGPGIPADVMARLFTPVRTQKGADHKGIGLSIVHNLVTKMGGHIHCNSGNGTVFELLLPLSFPSSNSRAAAR